MTTTNERLSALLDKREELRPTGLDIDGSGWFYRDGTSRFDEEAHALIFRAMVEGLPQGFELNRYMDSWAVIDTAEQRTFGDTAIDALVAYWEAQP